MRTARWRSTALSRRSLKAAGDVELDLHRAVGRTEEDEDVDFPPRLNESVSGWVGQAGAGLWFGGLRPGNFFPYFFLLIPYVFI
jgi:hypothetical protein